MASAVVRIKGPFGKGIPNKCVISAQCWFWGDDVSSDIDGQRYDLNVETVLNYSLADLKNDLVSTVQAKATELGLTVANNDISIPSYETG
jgi:hypothetical protein